MIFSRPLVLTALACALAFAPASPAAQPKRAAPTRPPSPDNATAFKGAIVIDAATGQTLFEDRADIVSPPASMTKLMTFAVLWDHLKKGTLTLETPVKITVADSKIGGTQVFLDPRETFPVEELIYAMMIQSANDAAFALARAASGSTEAFVAEMNAKARELGMTHSVFRSPHGLPPASRNTADGDLTTPREYATLCRHLLTKTDVLKYTSIRSRDFAPERAKGPMKMENHNKLLGKVPGVDGLKTGFTNGAGYCLSATAERNGRRLILVIMGSLGPGGQHDLGKTRDLKAVELIEHAFAAFPIGGPAFKSELPASPVSAAPTPPGQNKDKPTDAPLDASQPLQLKLPKK